MLKLIGKQHFYRTLVEKRERKLLVLNIIARTVPSEFVQNIISRKKSRLINLSKGITRIRNMCYLSSRARGTYRQFRLSRMFIKDLANTGFFIGVRKTGW